MICSHLEEMQLRTHLRERVKHVAQHSARHTEIMRRRELGHVRHMQRANRLVSRCILPEEAVPSVRFPAVHFPGTRFLGSQILGTRGLGQLLVFQHKNLVLVVPADGNLRGNMNSFL